MNDDLTILLNKLIQQGRHLPDREDVSSGNSYYYVPRMLLAIENHVAAKEYSKALEMLAELDGRCSKITDKGIKKVIDLAQANYLKDIVTIVCDDIQSDEWRWIDELEEYNRTLNLLRNFDLSLIKEAALFLENAKITLDKRLSVAQELVERREPAQDISPEDFRKGKQYKVQLYRRSALSMQDWEGYTFVSLQSKMASDFFVRKSQELNQTLDDAKKNIQELSVNINRIQAVESQVKKITPLIQEIQQTQNFLDQILDGEVGILEKRLSLGDAEKLVRRIRTLIDDAKQIEDEIGLEKNLSALSAHFDLHLVELYGLRELFREGSTWLRDYYLCEFYQNVRELNLEKAERSFHFVQQLGIPLDVQRLSSPADDLGWLKKICADQKDLDVIKEWIAAVDANEPGRIMSAEKRFHERFGLRPEMERAWIVKELTKNSQFRLWSEAGAQSAPVTPVGDISDGTKKTELVVDEKRLWRLLASENGLKEFEDVMQNLLERDQLDLYIEWKSRLQNVFKLKDIYSELVQSTDQLQNKEQIDKAKEKIAQTVDRFRYLLDAVPPEIVALTWRNFSTKKEMEERFAQIHLAAWGDIQSSLARISTQFEKFIQKVES